MISKMFFVFNLLSMELQVTKFQLAINLGYHKFDTVTKEYTARNVPIS